MNKTFIVYEWTPVILDWRQVLSSWDFFVSFSWDVLSEIEKIKWSIRRLNWEEKLFPVSTEHWDVYISTYHINYLH